MDATYPRETFLQPLRRNVQLGPSFERHYGLFANGLEGGIIRGTYRLDVIVLHGLLGIGKTETALHLISRYKDTVPREKIKVFAVDCSSGRQSFVRGLNMLAEDFNLDAFDPHFTNIFEQFFNRVNSKFPEHEKLILFDNVDLRSPLLVGVDNTIEEVKKARDNGNMKPWKIIITSRYCPGEVVPDPLEFLRHISKDNLARIEPFSRKQSNTFLSSCKHDLSAEIKEMLHLKLEGHPLAMTVARTFFDENVFENPDEHAQDYLDFLEDSYPAEKSLGKGRAVAAIKHGVLAEFGAHVTNMKVLKMLSILHSTITGEIMLSCTEVAMKISGIHQIPRPADIANPMATKLKGLSMCSVENQEVELHELVKLALTWIRDAQEDTAEKKWIFIRMALISLSRLIIQHQNGFGLQKDSMHEHLRKLAEFVREQNLTVRDKHWSGWDLIMLANILRYLAHCRLVLGVEEENRVSEVKELTVEALNYFSLAVNRPNYHELSPDIAENQSEEEGRAQILLRAVTDFEVNQGHIGGESVMHLSIIPLGNIQWSRSKRFRNQSEPIKPEEFRADAKILICEYLAEIYEVRARIFSTLQGDDLLNYSLDAAKAALIVCESTSQLGRKLVVEVTVERDCLLMTELHRNMAVAQVEGGEMVAEYRRTVKDKFQELKRIENNRYYRLVKTAIQTDPIHIHMCNVGIAGVEDLDDGRAHFDRLCNALLVHKGIVSETHRKYAEFEFGYGDKGKAVIQILTSMLCLHEYLRGKFRAGDQLPELVESGKFNVLYKQLTKYYNAWRGDDNVDNGRRTMLETGRHRSLIVYAEVFRDHHQRYLPRILQPDEELPYHLIRELIPDEQEVPVGIAVQGMR